MGKPVLLIAPAKRCFIIHFGLGIILLSTPLFQQQSWDFLAEFCFYYWLGYSSVLIPLIYHRFLSCLT